MKIVILILISFFVTACVTVAPVVNPKNEISIYGVSSLPPQDGDWILLTAAGYQMSLAKKGEMKNESLVANVLLYQMPEFSNNENFLNHVVKGRAKEPNIGRFEILKNEEELLSLHGTTCVRYHSISKDNAAQIEGGKTAEMLLENIGYHCIHPKKNTVGVNIEYSLRHYPNTTYVEFSKQANEYFNNIKFKEF